MAKSTKKKAPPKKLAAKKAAHKSPSAKPAAKKPAAKSAPHAKANATAKKGGNHAPDTMSLLGANHRERRLDPFTRQQKEKLLQLRDAMVDSMAGVAQDTLRSRAEGSEAS